MRELLQRRERALVEEIELADSRLAEIADAIASVGVTVEGSRPGTVRPHPLLRVENEVRRARARAHRELEDVLRRLENVRLIETANALARRSPQSPAS
jgi:hypothetical protein